MLEQISQRAVDRAVLADLRVRHAGVGSDFAASEAGVLVVARGLYAGAYDLGGLTRFSWRSSLIESAGASIWMSARSSKGPLMRER